MLFPLNWRSAIPRRVLAGPLSFNANPTMQTPGRFAGPNQLTIFSLRSSVSVYGLWRPLPVRTLDFLTNYNIKYRMGREGELVLRQLYRQMESIAVMPPTLERKR